MTSKMVPLASLSTEKKQRPLSPNGKAAIKRINAHLQKTLILKLSFLLFRQRFFACTSNRKMCVTLCHQVIFHLQCCPKSNNNKSFSRLQPQPPRVPFTWLQWIFKTRTYSLRATVPCPHPPRPRPWAAKERKTRKARKRPLNCLKPTSAPPVDSSECRSSSTMKAALPVD